MRLRASESLPILGYGFELGDRLKEEADVFLFCDGLGKQAKE